MQYLENALVILLLAYVQNISFSVVSRSRNRDNYTYHLIAACFSNGIWFLTMRQLVLADLNAGLIAPYIIGTVSGSLTGVKVSMWIERLIGATADGHVKAKGMESATAPEEQSKSPYTFWVLESEYGWKVVRCSGAGLQLGQSTLILDGLTLGRATALVGMLRGEAGIGYGIREKTQAHE